MKVKALQEAVDTQQSVLKVWEENCLNSLGGMQNLVVAIEDLNHCRMPVTGDLTATGSNVSLFTPFVKNVPQDRRDIAGESASPQLPYRLGRGSKNLTLYLD